MAEELGPSSLGNCPMPIPSVFVLAYSSACLQTLFFSFHKVINYVFSSTKLAYFYYNYRNLVSLATPIPVT